MFISSFFQHFSYFSFLDLQQKAISILPKIRAISPIKYNGEGLPIKVQRYLTSEATGSKVLSRK